MLSKQKMGVSHKTNTNNLYIPNAQTNKQLEFSVFSKIFAGMSDFINEMAVASPNSHRFLVVSLQACRSVAWKLVDQVLLKLIFHAN